MADPESRAKRYDNSPKGKRGGAPNKETEAAKSEAEKTAGRGMPHADDPGKVGKVDSDPGPEAGKDATWGVVASRHKQERQAMHKRHAEEHVAHATTRQEMVGRHHKEDMEMSSRHQKEMQDALEEGAEGEAERSAGSPKELGTAKPEGKGGSEP